MLHQVSQGMRSRNFLLWVTAIVLFPISGLLGYSSDELPELQFEELLEVLSVGTQMKTQDQLKQYPRMRLLYKEAGTSLSKSITEKQFLPDQVFGNLQSALGHHPGGDFALILQDVWILMELYEKFYHLNQGLISSGQAEPFVAFLEAIQKGFWERGGEGPLIAADSGRPNPIHYIRDTDLVFRR